jgi:hypothetical protein
MSIEVAFSPFTDVSVNGAIVGGALIAALILPTSGRSTLLPLLISLAYVSTSGYLLRSVRFPPRK